MKFAFRLEAQDGSGHFRQGAIAASSREEAKSWLEQREQEYAFYRLDSDELADAQADPGTAANRSRLALHEQAKPYKLVKLEKAK